MKICQRYWFFSFKVIFTCSSFCWIQPYTSWAKHGSKSWLENKYLMSCNSVICINFQHFGYQIRSGPIKHNLILRIIWLPDSFEQFLVGGSFEWENSCQGYKKKYPQSPNISCFSSVLFSLDNLRSHITRCSTIDLNFLSWRYAGAEPKVN